MSIENITPEAARSERTMRWTPIDRPTLKWSKPLSTRYEIARSVNSEAKQRLQVSSRAWLPWTFRYVSCWPAKLASGRSSAVALLRTATSSGLGAALRETFVRGDDRAPEILRQAGREDRLPRAGRRGCAGSPCRAVSSPLEDLAEAAVEPRLAQEVPVGLGRHREAVRAP